MTKEEIKAKIIEIRHHIHMHPETGMDTVETADYVAKIMEDLGCEVTRGIGTNGVVATMKCGDGTGMIGLRADMDALHIQEDNDLPYKSKVPGKMHGCGHDSHTATLIGAAMLLKETQDFNGTVVFVFQPGEEPGLGAKAMIADGLFEKFPMTEIYGQHNQPDQLIGTIKTRAGQIRSSEDDFWITIKGKGGHASAPHLVHDPLVAAAEIIMQLQTIISRNVNPQEAATVSCCDIKTDGVMNTLPTNITILGDCRTYNPEVSQLIEKKMRQIVAAVCEANDCEGEVKYDRVFVPAINDPVCTQVVLDTARKLFGEEKAILAERPGSASEDFGQFAAVVPGCLFDIGTMPEDAVTFAPKHNPHYVFNDDAILVGSEMFAQIVRERLK